MSNETLLEMWTVCSHPSDFPNNYTARRSVIHQGHVEMTGDVILGDTLAEVRNEMIMRGLTNIPRNPADDPVIVEVWL